MEKWDTGNRRDWCLGTLITSTTLGRSHLCKLQSTCLHSVVLTGCSYGSFQNADVFWFHEELQLLGADYSCHLVAESEAS